MRVHGNKYIFTVVYNGKIGVAIFDKHGSQFYERDSDAYRKAIKPFPSDIKNYCGSAIPEYYLSITAHCSIFTGRYHSYMGDEYTGELKELIFPPDETTALAEQVIGKVPPALLKTSALEGKSLLYTALYLANEVI